MYIKNYFNNDPSHYKRLSSMLEAMPNGNVWEMSAHVERERYKLPRREW